jgi:hypothetical protein
MPAVRPKKSSKKPRGKSRSASHVKSKRPQKRTTQVAKQKRAQSTNKFPPQVRAAMRTLAKFASTQGDPNLIHRLTVYALPKGRTHMDVMYNFSHNAFSVLQQNEYMRDRLLISAPASECIN